MYPQDYDRSPVPVHVFLPEPEPEREIEPEPETELPPPPPSGDSTTGRMPTVPPPPRGRCTSGRRGGHMPWSDEMVKAWSRRWRQYEQSHPPPASAKRADAVTESKPSAINGRPQLSRDDMRRVVAVWYPHVRHVRHSTVPPPKRRTDPQGRRHTICLAMQKFEPTVEAMFRSSHTGFLSAVTHVDDVERALRSLLGQKQVQEDTLGFVLDLADANSPDVIPTHKLVPALALYLALRREQISHLDIDCRLEKYTTLNKTQIRALLAELDGGVVPTDEEVQWVMITGGVGNPHVQVVRSVEDSERAARAAFEAVDADNSGLIGKTELRHLNSVLSPGAPLLDSKQLDQAIKDIAATNGGLLHRNWQGGADQKGVDFQQFFRWYRDRETVPPDLTNVLLTQDPEHPERGFRQKFEAQPVEFVLGALGRRELRRAIALWYPRVLIRRDLAAEVTKAKGHSAGVRRRAVAFQLEVHKLWVEAALKPRVQRDNALTRRDLFDVMLALDPNGDGQVPESEIEFVLKLAELPAGATSFHQGDVALPLALWNSTAPELKYINKHFEMYLSRLTSSL